MGSGRPGYDRLAGQYAWSAASASSAGRRLGTHSPDDGEREEEWAATRP
jgi:hypothetical protein